MTIKILKKSLVPSGKKRLESPVSLYRGISNKLIKYTTVGEVFERMTDVENQSLIQLSTRLETAKRTDSATYKQIKEKELPAVIPGIFPKKLDSACELYTGLLFFDIDHVGSAEAKKEAWEIIPWRIEELIDILKGNPFVFAAFPSPSRQGLRILVWTDSKIDTHKDYYESLCSILSAFLKIPTDKALRADLKAQGKPKKDADEIIELSEIIDTSTSNPARIWFYSHVPKDLFYLNLDANVYVLKDVKRPLPPSHQAPGKLVSEDDKVSLCLGKVNERQDLPSGRNNFVFAFAAELCRHGVPMHRALSECLAYQELEFGESEIKKTIESAYKSKPFGEFKDGQIAKYKKLVNGVSASAAPADTILRKEKEAIPALPPEFENDKDNLPKIVRMRRMLDYLYEFRLNIIANEIEYSRKKKNEFQLLNENDLIIELLEAGFTGVEQPLIALLKSSFVPRHNPFWEYFQTLPAWDETQPDYITELANYVEATDQFWFNQQFKKVLVRTIACALEIIPFNKHCLTLKGEQNDGKSTFLRFLVPPALKNYTADHFDPNNKDGLFALCQNFIINLDELSQFSKTDIRKVKAIFTYDHVKERLPYDKRPTNHPRRTSFVASTNDDEFLVDETGNVRWLIFEIQGIKHDNGGANGYAKNMDINKVYAQAFALLQSGFNFSLTPEEIEKSERNNRQFQMTTIEMELIQQFFSPAKEKEEGSEFVQSKDIIKAIEHETKQVINTRSVSRALRLLGFKAGSNYNPEKRFSLKGFWVRKIGTE